MEHPIIKIENLSKKYVLGTREPYYSLRDSLANIFKSKKKPEEFWALNDVNLEIQKGEVVGIIGPNGAGKSTLLKILSQITPPTAGKVMMRGRVASLLEVGTGFNMELTGRENIWLNGAILGMSKQEIAAKFDEIVAFAEIGQFLDTPVKHYSSGMYVRLAFAVAAHLEPEILIVDEVLAVGDAAFQKKCLGKMGEAAKGGRTVLFVSHNMAAIQRLCQRVVLIEKGQVIDIGEPEKIIERYMMAGDFGKISWQSSGEQETDAYFKRIYLIDENGQEIKNMTTATNFSLALEFTVKRIHKDMQLSTGILDGLGEVIFSSNIADCGLRFPEQPGTYKAFVQMPRDMLMPKSYIVRTTIWTPTGGAFDSKDAISFIPVEVDSLCNSTPGGRAGMISARCQWELTEK